MEMLPALVGSGVTALGAWGLGRFREWLPEPRSVSDLLRWRLMANPQVLLQNDGTFLTTWSFRGPDPVTAGAEDHLALANLFAEACAGFGGGFSIWVDALRLPHTAYPSGEFPDPISAAIDEERRRSVLSLARYTVQQYVTLAFRPPTSAFRTKGLALLRGEPPSDWLKELGAFGDVATSFERRLSVGLRLERLSQADLLGFLHSCYSFETHPISVEGPPYGLNCLLATRPLDTRRLQVGKKRLAVLSVSGFPGRTVPAMLAGLSETAASYRWSTRLVFRERARIGATIRQRRIFWNRRVQGTTPKEATARTRDVFEDVDALTMAGSTRDALASLSRGESFADTTTAILVAHEDAEALEASTQLVRRALEEAGFPVLVEDLNAPAAFIGSLPGHLRNRRRHLIPGTAFADVLPLCSTWSGQASCPCSFMPAGSPTHVLTLTGSTPFHLDLHVGDVGHTLILGPTGAGKSTLVGLLAAQFLRYRDAQVFLFDVGYSAAVLTLALGGVHFELQPGEGTSLQLQPLRHISDPREQAWAAEWIESLLGFSGEVTAQHRVDIAVALRHLALEPADARTLTSFSIALQSTELRQRLAAYQEASSFGLLDGVTPADDDAGANVMTWELQHLLSAADPFKIPVLLALFRSVERRLTGRPTLLILEEAWSALLHAKFRSKLLAWLRTLRKLNASVVLATQSLTQLAGTDAQEIFEAAPTRLLLPNPEALHGSRALYERLGLRAHEIALLATATKKRDYVFVSPEGTRLIDLGLGPTALAFLTPPSGVTPIEALRRARALEAVQGTGWPAAWLQLQEKR
ncbi:MAG TPA: DUF87 domain-containing protein [Thermoanaerobaculia bacterium]|nr:DUF87 domain-containing protein [Thermoanaerobaculia bacterium]